MRRKIEIFFLFSIENCEKETLRRRQQQHLQLPEQGMIDKMINVCVMFDSKVHQYIKLRQIELKIENKNIKID